MPKTEFVWCILIRTAIRTQKSARLATYRSVRRPTVIDQALAANNPAG